MFLRLLAFPFLRSVSYINWNHDVSSSIVAWSSISIWSLVLQRCPWGSSLPVQVHCVKCSLWFWSHVFFSKPYMGYLPFMACQTTFACLAQLFTCPTHCHLVMTKSEVKKIQYLNMTCCNWKLICINLVHGILLHGKIAQNISCKV